MKLEPCRWDISACEVQFLLSQSLCFWLSFHCCEQLSKKIHSQYFLGGICFHFFPCVSKRFQFSFFFFANSLHWYRTLQMIWNNLSLEEKFLVELYKKKNLQKSFRRLCPIMDCSTGERILIYIFLKN